MPVASRQESRDAWLLWRAGFVYASLAALCLQFLVLPMLPEAHAGNGLLHRDAVYYHRVAEAMAAQIRSEGWVLYPGAGLPGHVSLLAILYALFGAAPALLIPFNAAVHALGAALLYRIGRRLWPGPAGRLGGIIAALFFLLAPSALSWYGQTLKDSYFIAGFLLLVQAWLSALRVAPRAGAMLRLLGLSLLAVLLIAFVRPHYLPAVGAAWLLSWLAVMAAGWRARLSRSFAAGVPVLLALLLVGGLHQAFAGRLTGDIARLPAATHTAFPPEKMAEMNWKWRDSPWLPAAFDSMLGKLSTFRVQQVALNSFTGARTAIDTEQRPSDAGEALAYLPRALAIGLLAPFPDTWQQAPDAQRLVAAGETMLWYALLPGVVVLLLRNPSRALLAGAVACLALLSLMAYALPNVGTLYRVRFAPHFFFILCGAVGWARIILQLIGQAERGRRQAASGADLPSLGGGASRGAVVILLTAAGYLLFLVRDLLLLREWGAGRVLDAFFTAAMLPNVVTALLVAPLMDAAAPLLQRTGLRNGQALLARRVLWLGALAALPAGVLVWLLAAPLAELLLGAGSAVQAEAADWLRWHAAVIPLSLLVMTGNALLNARGMSRQSALAQLWPPALTAAAAALLLPVAGLYATALGLLLGLVVNAWQVHSRLRREVLPWPLCRPPPAAGERALLRGWAALGLAAAATQLAVPVNYWLAGMLDAGSVSIWSISSKISQGFGFLAGAAISAVLLPFAGAMANMGHHELLRRDLHFVLITGSWLATLISLLIFVFSRPFAVVLLNGGQMGLEQAEEAAQIIRLGGLQLPFLFASTLLLRMTAATRRVRLAAAAGLAGLAANVLLAAVLMPSAGLHGLAVAALAGSALPAVLLLVQHTGWDARRPPLLLAQVAFWLALAGLAMAIDLAGTAAGAVCALLLAALPLLQWRWLRQWSGQSA